MTPPVPVLGIDSDIEVDPKRKLMKATEVAYDASWRTPGFMPPPPFTALIEFMEIKVNTPLKDNQLNKGLNALIQLREIMGALAKPHPELAPHVQRINDDMVRIAKACRTSLMRWFLSPSATPSDMVMLTACLLDLIQGGYWESWREDMEAELARLEAGVERCRTN
jgi:hypothetical protein